jgi:hypothetical protein
MKNYAGSSGKKCNSEKCNAERERERERERIYMEVKELNLSFGWPVLSQSQPIFWNGKRGLCRNAYVLQDSLY